MITANANPPVYFFKPNGEVYIHDSDKEISINGTDHQNLVDSLKLFEEKELNGSYVIDFNYNSIGYSFGMFKVIKNTVENTKLYPKRITWNSIPYDDFPEDVKNKILILGIDISKFDVV